MKRYFGYKNVLRVNLATLILFLLIYLVCNLYGEAFGGTGSLNLSKYEAYLNGDTVVVTLIDNDLNTTSGSDTSSVNVISSSDDTGGAGATVTMTENASNSGTFLGTFITASFTDDSASPDKIKAVANGTITVTYEDTSPAANITAFLSTKNFGAVLDISEDSVYLEGNAVVSLYDPETNTSVSSENLVNVNVTSTTDSSGTTLRLTETGNDTGSFLGTIAVSAGSTLVNSSIQAAIGDTVTISFTDNPDAAGSVSVVSDTAIVTEEIPPITTPAPTPSPITTVTPTVTVVPSPITIPTISAPTVETSSATNVTKTTATLNGIVNANGVTAYAWFEYGAASGSYSRSTRTQTITGTSDTGVSADISGLSEATTYYYRIVAQNSEGTSYGDEKSFTTSVTAPSAVTSYATNVTSDSATLNGFVNANGNSAEAWFEYGAESGSYSNSSSTESLDGSSYNSVSIEITGLSSNTTYYYRIVAENDGGASYGGERSFTTESLAPEVSTDSATNITENSATLNGTVNANGLTTTVWFEYGTSRRSLSEKTSTQSVNGTEDTQVSLDIGDLTVNITYYYRIVAENSDGTTSGNVRSFTTSYTAAPTAETDSATNITPHRAMLNGTVNANGSTTTIWFEYGTESGSYTRTTSSKFLTGTSDTEISANISGLKPETTYYYRIVAQNSYGKTNGDEVEFTTTAIIPPTVTTESAIGIAAISATLKGTVNPNGSPTQTWFEYGVTSESYSNTTWKRALSGSADITISNYVRNLIPETTYYYRIVAENTAGITNGNEVSFTTSSLDTTGYIVGTVLDAETRVGIEGATVETDSGDYSTTTDSSGSYQIEADVGRYIVTASAEGYQSSSQIATVTPAAEVSVNFSLTPEIKTGNIAGRVYDEDTGVSIAGAEVRIFNSGYSTETDENGNYEINDVAVGTYRLVASAAGYDSSLQTVTVTESETTQVDFPLSLQSEYNAIVFGAVEDEDNEPFSEVMVTIENDDFSDKTETDKDGDYVFRDLAGGDYTLTFEADEYKLQTKNISIGEGEIFEVETVVMEPTASGKVYGYVFDAEGAIIESVNVKVKSVTTGDKVKTKTNEEGYFELEKLEADTYKLVVKKKYYKKNKQTITLSENEEKYIEVILEKK